MQNCLLTVGGTHTTKCVEETPEIDRNQTQNINKFTQYKMEDFTFLGDSGFWPFDRCAPNLFKAIEQFKEHGWIPQ